MKPIKTAVQMPSFERLYSSYNVEGPLYTEHGSAYMLLTAKEGSDAPTLYVRYEYALMENIRGEKLRYNRKVYFKDGNHFNYTRINLKSVVVGDANTTHPLLGYGAFKNLVDVDMVYQETNTKQGTYTPATLPSNSLILKSKSTRVINPNALDLPSMVICSVCKKQVVLSRFQQYSYVKHNKRSFMHPECSKIFFKGQRGIALQVRRDKKLMVSPKNPNTELKLVHYKAKKPLSAAEASAHGSEYFEANYHKVGKDFLPDIIINTLEVYVPMRLTLIDPDEGLVLSIKRALDVHTSLEIYSQGPAFILFEVLPPQRGKSTPKRKPGTPKEFIHASW